MKQQQTGSTVFFSYAQADQAVRDQLAIHLSQLKRDGLIEAWSDQQILAGSDRTQEIDQALRRSRIILLLISADFLASDTCYDVEMQQALERHRTGVAHIIPIIVRPCDWQSSPFAHLQCLPRNARPVTLWRNRDEAFAAIVQELRKVIADLPHLRQSASPLSTMDRKNRMYFLDKVYETWITTFLEQVAWSELGLEERRDLLPNPWRFQVQEMEQVPRLLPTGTTIEQVYEQINQGQLLIVGAPGSGKTTQLLHLARSLIEQAKQDETRLIPAVFALSSWAQKRLPLAEWLIEELWTRYEVPSQVRQEWVREGRLLPLLDGLDEVSSEHRSACVEAINSYLQAQLEQKQQAVPLVICCRSQDYRDLVPRLVVQRAIQLLPLSDEQIDTYFQQGGAAVEPLRQAVREDEELHELARQPLMLSVFTLAYQGADQQKVPVGKTREETLRLVWNTYIDRMLHRRGSLQRWTEQQARDWLRTLAQQMNQRNQTIFEVESLQRDWLPPRARRVFPWCSGVLFGGFFGAVLGLLGVVLGVISGPLTFGVVGVVLSPHFGTQRIIPAEKLAWRWKDSIRGVLIGMPIGLLAGVVVGMLIGPVMAVVVGVLVGVSTGTLGGIIFGVKKTQLIERKVLRPNEGIRRSGSSGVLIGGLASVLSGVLFGGLANVLIGVHLGTLAGVIIGVFTGGDAFLLHYLLRVFLWRTGMLPLTLVAFLDEMADRLLLRRVGGSYVFIHRLLLEHFAHEHAGTTESNNTCESKNDA